VNSGGGIFFREVGFERENGYHNLIKDMERFLKER